MRRALPLQVPTAHGKADLTNYRSEGSKASAAHASGRRDVKGVAGIRPQALRARTLLADSTPSSPPALPAGAGHTGSHGQDGARQHRCARSGGAACTGRQPAAARTAVYQLATPPSRPLLVASPPDEAYVDLTAEAHRRLEESGGMPQLPVNPEQVHVMQEAGFEGAAGWWQRPPEAWRPGEQLLAAAAAAVADLRAAVAAELGYTCSAGVAHTKILAKLCSG